MVGRQAVELFIIRLMWVTKRVSTSLSGCGLSYCPMHLPKALPQRILSTGTQFLMCAHLDSLKEKPGLSDAQLVLPIRVLKPGF